MRAFTFAAWLASNLALLWPLTAMAHGGPPQTHEILWTSNDISLITTHGFFSEESEWAWVCEEASGANLAASIVRTDNRWFVGTIYGLKTSIDGCNWTDDPVFSDMNILRVLRDVTAPEDVWAATTEGLWHIDSDGKAKLESTFDFSVRHFGQNQDGVFLIVGFDGPQPVADLNGERIELPAETGKIEVLGADPKGRFYLRFPAGATDRLIRVSTDGATVLIPTTDLIRDVAFIDDELYVLYPDGISWSSNDGLSWSDRSGEAIRCLQHRPDGFYACPETTGESALLYAPKLGLDPALWTWESLLDFNQVRESICEAGSTAGDICPYLWYVVVEELGLAIPEPAPVETKSTGGCTSSSLPSVFWIPTLVLFFLLTRRKNQSV